MISPSVESDALGTAVADELIEKPRLPRAVDFEGGRVERVFAERIQRNVERVHQARGA